MPRVITTPDGIRVTLPTGATDEQVMSVLKRRKQMMDSTAAAIPDTSQAVSAPQENPQQIQPQPQTPQQSRAGQFSFPQGMTPADVQQLMTGIQNLPRDWVSQLPAMGAAAGGAVTMSSPPGIMAGGGAGRALQQVLAPAVGLEQPKSLDKGYLQQAQSAATQGLLNQVPQELQTAAKAVGQGLMQTSLGKLGARGARTAATAISARIGPGLRRMGTAQAQGVIKEAAARVDAMLQHAKKEGMWHETEQAIQGGKKLLSDEALTTLEHGKVMKWNDELLRGKGPKIDPVTLNRLRQRYDQEADKIFKAGKKFGGGAMQRIDDLRARWAKETADHMRAMLHDPTVSPAAVPGLGTEQGRLSMAMDLRDALAPVEARGANKVLPYAHGVGALGGAYWLTHHIDNPYLRAAAMAGLTYGLSPFGLSQAGLALSSPALGPTLSVAGRAAAPIADVATQKPQTTP